MNLGLMTVKSNADMVQEEQEQAKREVEARQSSALITSLASWVRECWQAARQAKEPHKNAMLQSLRQRNGEYEPDKLREIEESGAGATIFMHLTDEKCNAAESWIEDILLPPDDKPWGVKPSPEPELGPQQMQAMQEQAAQMAQQSVQQMVAQAQQQGQQVSQGDIEQLYQQSLQEVMTEMQSWVSEQAQKANEQLESALEECLSNAEWADALKESIADMITYRAGFLKGPLVHYKEQLVWQEGEPAVERIPTIVFERVSPFDIYPAPSSRKVNDGYIIEKHTLTRSDLLELKGPDTGFDEGAIDKVLSEYGRGGLRNWLWMDSEAIKDDLQGRGYEVHDPESRIEALQYWGSVSGLMLIEWGMDPKEIEPMEEYQAEVWLIGSYVIKAELNGDILGRKPYFKASFRERNGQFWGLGLPELIKDCQDACNAAARNLLNNMGISSGPQAWVDVSALPPGEDVTQMYPWKIWQMDGQQLGSSSRPPLEFFQPNPNIEALMSVYDKFSVEADNKSGIPKYSYGGSSQGDSGAADTASGFSMMMDNATKGIKKIVKNVDRGIIRGSVKRMFQYKMLNDPEFVQKYGGDVDIIARGSNALVAKEQQQVRRNEFLQMVFSSPVAQQIIGMPGMAEILREVVRGLDIGLENVVPTKEQVRQQQVRAQAQQAMQQAEQGQQGQQQKVQGPRQGRQTQPGGAVSGGSDARLF